MSQNNSKAQPIHSMTGFCSVEGEISTTRYRLEMKALNHRFLDLKVRMPRELSAAEIPLRSFIQGAFSRGAVELKIERINDGASGTKNDVQPNIALAASYYEALIKLQRTLGLSDVIPTTALASFPEVMSQSGRDFSVDEAWKQLEPLVKSGIQKLQEMRQHEGSALTKLLRDALSELDEKVRLISSRRKDWETSHRKRVQEKITTIFEAHPIADKTIQTVLDSRIAQELALLLDRTDIEEEVTRFTGHLEHFRKTIDQGGPLGRKLDFILQELGREINTLGNKAQDLLTSEEVVTVKVRLEQLREQVMNLE